ncbi:hypothetical protein R4K92_03760 [Brachyspira intermedia]|uniref:phage GP46 family protein n=1 Tax=Brachyspira TaxID=29521 RepID=UPI0026F2F815|nr:phage GP46 family protein [Brachyspira innocens]
MNYKDGDVLLSMTNDGLDINIKNNLIECTSGFETAIYLSLFGGNEKDDSSNSNEKYTWWGNNIQSIDYYKSNTLSIITGKNANARNLQLLEKAILLDLNWIIEQNIADTIEVNCTIPNFNELEIQLKVLRDNKLISKSNYKTNWETVK